MPGSGTERLDRLYKEMSIYKQEYFAQRKQLIYVIDMPVVFKANLYSMNSHFDAYIQGKISQKREIFAQLNQEIAAGDKSILSNMTRSAINGNSLALEFLKECADKEHTVALNYLQKYYKETGNKVEQMRCLSKYFPIKDLDDYVSIACHMVVHAHDCKKEDFTILRELIISNLEKSANPNARSDLDKFGTTQKAFADNFWRIMQFISNESRRAKNTFEYSIVPVGPAAAAPAAVAAPVVVAPAVHDDQVVPNLDICEEGRAM